ncbi:MAG: hypothetical protein H7Z43_00760, partial [Clostridia bacterium]|nr:hypothetical protein [Deltaproteobacteria bacterium]
SGCTFTLDRRPPDVTQLYVFTQPNGSSTYNPVSNDPANADGYFTYDDSQLRLQLNGAVCDRVRDGIETPTVIYGCATPGG